MEFSTTITVGGKPVILADEKLIKNTEAWKKANSIFCPLGHANSEAWLLLTKANLDSVSTGLQTIIWKQVTRSQSSSDTVENEFPGWRLIRAERIFNGGTSDQNLYLCKFGDARYFAELNSDSGTVTANIRSYAQYDNYLTETDGETWVTLLTDLWNNCGLGVWPGLPAGLPVDSVPDTQIIIGLNSYKSLCAILEQLDCAIKHNVTTNVYTIVQLGENQDVPENKSRLIWNSEPVKSNSQIAAFIKVYFHKHYKNYGQEPDTELSGNWTYNGHSDSLIVATGVAGAIGTRPLWDDMPWVLGEDGTNTNSSDLATRATNRKLRYVTRHSVSLYHKIFSGIMASDYEVGGQVRAVLFRNWGDGQNRFGGTVTEVMGGPELVGYLNDVIENRGEALESFSPPDLSRKSYPNYPRLPNVVQVCHCNGEARGDTVPPNSDGLHRAKVKRIVNGTMETLETCWLLFIDDYDNLLGDVDAIQGQYYGPARLTGIITSEGQTHPLYLLRNYESGVDTSLTTTTTIPPIIRQCYGRVKWIWDEAGNEWLEDSNTCSETTTTTTTSSSTTTTPAPEDDYCGCASEPATTSTSTTTSSTTSSTTTTTPVVCRPVYPQYCGSVDGECVYTTCSSGYVNTTLDCTSTTCDCNTTTTTPNCNDCCQWTKTVNGWIKTIDNCGSRCSCSEPEVTGSNCDTYLNGFPLPPCGGDCEHIWYDNIGWVTGTNGCSNGYGGCYCVPPSYDGVHCGIAKGTCQTTEPENCGHCYSTTTTPNPLECNGYCKWSWSVDTSLWTQTESNCNGGCGCVPPAYDGTDSCEVTWTHCTSISTTTTTTTTTTASCCPAAGKTCIYRFDFTLRQWYVYQDNCGGGGCSCPDPSEMCLPCMDCITGGVAQKVFACGKWNYGAFINGDSPDYAGNCSAYACSDATCYDYYADQYPPESYGSGYRPAGPYGPLDSTSYSKCGGGDCWGGPRGAYCVLGGGCYEYLTPTEADAIGGGTYYPCMTCAELIAAGLTCTITTTTTTTTTTTL